MQKKNKKHVLIVIIILLVLFLPLGVIGFIFALEGKESSLLSKAPTNINQEFYYEGFLYFYSETDKLLGVYECENKNGYCGYALETIDDPSYTLLYYNDGEVNEIKRVNDKYAFVMDTANKEATNNVIYLYNFIDNRVVAELSAVKDYTIGIESNRYIVRDMAGKWGIMTFSSDNPVTVVPFEYNYIGISDNKNEDGLLIGDKYAVYKDSEWYIIDSNNALLSEAYDREIANYNGNYVITKSLYYYVYDYTGKMLYDSNGYREVTFTGNFINLLGRNNLLVIVDPSRDEEITPEIEVPSNVEYSVYIEGSSLIVEVNGQKSTYPLADD